MFPQPRRSRAETHVLLDDLYDRLTSQSVATTAELYKATLPSTPDEALALFEYGGPAPVHAMTKVAVAEEPHVQVIGRATRPDTAKFRVQRVMTELDGLGPVTINGVSYLGIYALQPPFFLRTDEAGRYEFAMNFAVTRVPATSS